MLAHNIMCLWLQRLRMIFTQKALRMTALASCSNLRNQWSLGLPRQQSWGASCVLVLVRASHRLWWHCSPYQRMCHYQKPYVWSDLRPDMQEWVNSGTPIAHLDENSIEGCGTGRINPVLYSHLKLCFGWSSCVRSLNINTATLEGVKQQ